MRLQFTLAKFDSWDAESVFIYKDNVFLDKLLILLLKEQFYVLNPWWEYDFTLPKGQNYVNFQMLDNLQADNEESWGMKDVILQLVNPCVNFYSE